MYVCVCRRVTDCEVKKAITRGCRTLDSLSKELSLGTQCGSCCCHAEELLAEFAEVKNVGTASAGCCNPSATSAA